MSDEGTLRGKVALVTGGGRGIGAAIAVALARAGADVAIGFRADEASADAVRARIEARGRRCTTVRGDVSVPADVLRIVHSAEEALGTVDVLVNNAGVATPRTLDALTDEDWHRAIAQNLTSAYLVTQAVLPGMRQRRRGSIVNVSSVAAQVGGIVGPHYAAAKAGVLGLTRGYAAQLARDGITVNAIAPALIETEMTASNPNARPDLIPVGRFGAAAEVAAVAVMLAANGYVTGQTVHVNGGIHMT